MLKKSVIAIFVCGVLPTLVGEVQAQGIVVRPGETITLPSETIDSITFETQGKDFEQSLGKDKNIPVLNVIGGLLLDERSGGGKTAFSISAKETNFGGIHYGTSTTPTTPYHVNSARKYN